MVYIESAKEFIELIYKHDEVLLCTEGEEKTITLEFLKYTNSINRVCCLVKERVDHFSNIAQKFDYSLPIIPFEHLPHFHESGLMVVAAHPKFYKLFEQTLTSLGFQKVIFIHPTALEQMTAYVNQVLKSGEALTRTINDLTNKIDNIEYLIAEQNEICAVNTKTFAEYKNCFRDKEIVIVAGGPTLKHYVPIADAIHIGLNFAWRHENISLDHLFVQDITINKQGANVADGFDKIKDKIFVGRFSKTASYNWIEFSENFSLNMEKFRRYFLNKMDFNQPLHKDICYHGLADFGSVVFPAIHFALFTYPKKIYLAGCDTSNKGHFYDDKKTSDNKIKLNTRTIKIGYARMKIFAKQYYPDTEIISINPVGLKGLFKDVYTDEYKDSMSKGE